MSAAGRLRLQRAFRFIEGKPVCFVGHSVGLTFNLAMGECGPIRRKPRRRLRSGGYQVLKSNLDIFVFASSWRLWRNTGYQLRSHDSATRIRRELEKLQGNRIISIYLIGSTPRLVVIFQDGTRLDLAGNSGDEEDPYGWNLTGLPGLKRDMLSLLD